MSWRYIGLSLLDSLTAPYLWIGFGLGVLTATGTLTFMAWGGVRPALRHMLRLWRGSPVHDAGTQEQGYLTSVTEYETICRDDRWLHVDHHDDEASFVFMLVDEVRLITLVYRLNPSQSLGLYKWMHRRMFPPSTPPTTRTEVSQ